MKPTIFYQQGAEAPCNTSQYSTLHDSFAPDFHTVDGVFGYCTVRKGLKPLVETFGHYGQGTLT
jgi:hypothetical protein